MAAVMMPMKPLPIMLMVEMLIKTAFIGAILTGFVFMKILPMLSGVKWMSLMFMESMLIGMLSGGMLMKTFVLRRMGMIVGMRFAVVSLFPWFKHIGSSFSFFSHIRRNLYDIASYFHQ